MNASARRDACPADRQRATVGLGNLLVQTGGVVLAERHPLQELGDLRRQAGRTALYQTTQLGSFHVGGTQRQLGSEHSLEQGPIVTAIRPSAMVPIQDIEKTIGSEFFTGRQCRQLGWRDRKADTPQVRQAPPSTSLSPRERKLQQHARPSLSIPPFSARFSNLICPDNFRSVSVVLSAFWHRKRRASVAVAHCAEGQACGGGKPEIDAAP